MQFGIGHFVIIDRSDVIGHVCVYSKEPSVDDAVPAAEHDIVPAEPGARGQVQGVLRGDRGVQKDRVQRSVADGSEIILPELVGLNGFVRHELFPGDFLIVRIGQKVRLQFFLQIAGHGGHLGDLDVREAVLKGHEGDEIPRGLDDAGQAGTVGVHAHERGCVQDGYIPCGEQKGVFRIEFRQQNGHLGVQDVGCGIVLTGMDAHDGDSSLFSRLRKTVSNWFLVMVMILES